MHLLRESVSILAYGAIIFSVVEIYLTLNKLWSRKHIQEVAESISISARVIGMIPCSIFTLNYFLQQQWQGVIDGSLWLIAASIQIMIGAGFWVVTKQKYKLWDLISQSIQRETREVSNLAMSVFQSSSREKLIDLLAAIALLDKVINEEEKLYVEKLAKEWDIPLIWGAHKSRIRNKGVSPHVIVSQELQVYLEYGPTRKEMKLLRQLIKGLLDVSGSVTEDHAFILAEFNEVFKRYPNTQYKQYYQIQVVPQEKEQHEILQGNHIKMKSEYLGSGFTYTIEPFFVEAYADKVVKEFGELGFFCSKQFKP